MDHRKLIPCCALLALATPVLFAVAGDSPDHIAGNWLGQTGPDDNRFELGLEITRNQQGTWDALVYADLLDFYRVPAGPPLKEVSPGRFSNEVNLTLTLTDGLISLSGFHVDKQTTIHLRRVENLPKPAPRTVWPAGPGPRWQTRTGGAIFAAAAVRDGVAYVGNVDGAFLAINIGDGSHRWAFPAGRPIYGEALATEDAVYFVCDNGYLFKLNRTDGKEIWRYDLGDGRVSRILPNPVLGNYDHQSPRPVLAESVLYLGSGDGGFHAVRADTGTGVWRIASNGKIRTTAALHGANAIFGTARGQIAAVERATGKLVWQFDAGAPVTSSPSLVGGRLIVGSRGSRLHGLDPVDGRALWSQQWWGSWVESAATDAAGLAFIGSGDLNRVSCIDPATGRNLWRTFVGGWVLRQPAVSAKQVFASVSSARRSGNFWQPTAAAITALDRESGCILWSWPLPEVPGTFLKGLIASPTLAGDTLLVGGLDGTLYAFPVE